MRIARFLPSLGLFLLGLPLVALGCNPKLATVLESDEAGAAPGTGGNDPSAEGGTTTVPDGGTSAPACETKGGKCLPLGETPRSPQRKANPGEASCPGTDVCWLPLTSKPTSPVCYDDPGCNEDATVSSLWGACFGGLCICNPGYTVQPSGKCGKLPAPDCTTQAGKCTQQPATCPSGSLESTNETNTSCGDLIAAVCCFSAATCGGPSVEVAGAGRTPIEMVCCAPNDALKPPICVNGWQTCQPGLTAVDKKFGCF